MVPILLMRTPRSERGPAQPWDSEPGSGRGAGTCWRRPGGSTLPSVVGNPGPSQPQWYRAAETRMGMGMGEGNIFSNCCLLYQGKGGERCLKVISKSKDRGVSRVFYMGVSYCTPASHSPLQIFTSRSTSLWKHY